MNKSIATNGLAALLVLVGFGLDNNIVKTVGLFALSGALTNWLAVHMLFEKVPGLYGSGVIPEHFEDFKLGIRNLIMEQFFNSENIQRFLTDNKPSLAIHVGALLKKVDLNPTFDSLVAVIKESSFGQMLGMFGGEAALEPLKQPFVTKMETSLEGIVQDPAFMAALQEQLAGSNSNDDLIANINKIVEQRLNELTPTMVKVLVQQMIKQHLAWLVVWGGVFGGLIGLIAAIFV
ncbi:DUF445 family protein [Aliiglaciecola sp. 2_MG-2023]|uniref:DUF445 family protein n=1 Tax=unclassified Aliiglaciecola TaxID=2593648 RepID=UPI0026E243B8|nr:MULTISPECIES: DUF445 family protein [unclassified Aliiglaciecola]MDO6709700.1 DUF445 family protein [Aliiglaciecola sp. 2_MG-2023]MDO6750758.1 DUF445 family protein [Aliiglaciecola sp. 1_MG-2023]